MKPDLVRLLLVESAPRDVDLGPRPEAEVESVPSLSAALTRLADRTEPIDVVFLDLELPDAEGLDALRRLQEALPLIPIVVLTRVDERETALEALRFGADDYLLEDEVDGHRLWRSARNAVERKRTEAALRRSRHLLAQAERLAHIGAWEWDIPRDRFFFSDEWLRIHGVADESLGLDELMTLAHPADRDRIRRAFDRALDGSEGYDIEHRVVRADDGAVRQISAQGEVDRDGSGRPVRMYGTAQDVTKRREAEAALRRSEAAHRALVEHAPYGIYRSAPDGSFLSVNPALVKMLGYGSAEELLAIDMTRDLYVDPGARPQLVDRYRDRDSVESVEVEWRRKDGAPLTVRLRGRPVRDGEGELRSFEMFVEDVTERRRLENELRQAQKMEAIGKLTGGIAHDFNNELSVIRMSAELIGQAIEDQRPVSRRDVVDIEEAASRATSMTRQLLGFSRKAELATAPTDLGQVLTAHISMLERVLPARIEVRLSVEEQLPTVVVDPNAVEQILLNLATNACDAMPDGGILDIQIDEVPLGETYASLHPYVEPGRYVRTTVSDNGIGMDSETRDRVFEPFFSTKEPTEGTGLGMSMVYGLVKQQGGYVHVYSEPGRGTSVRLYFPVVEESPQPFEKRLPRGEVGSGTETILLVEDEKAVRRAACRVLEQHGYSVIETSDGGEALDAFRSREGLVDLVLSDLVMPRMSGAELYEALREEGHEVAFVLTTGYSGPEAEAARRIKSEVGFVEKPWNIEQLLGTVRRTLDERR